MNVVAELMKWLDEQKQGLADINDRLIMEDAPKNKFSINTGKRQMIEEVKDKIEVLILEDSQGTNP